MCTGQAQPLSGHFNPGSAFCCRYMDGQTWRVSKLLPVAFRCVSFVRLQASPFLSGSDVWKESVRMRQDALTDRKKQSGRILSWCAYKKVLLTFHSLLTRRFIDTDDSMMESCELNSWILQMPRVLP